MKEWSSQARRKKDIERLGATAATGTIKDMEFLATTFTGADGVCCMLPVFDYFEPATDLRLGPIYVRYRSVVTFFKVCNGKERKTKSGSHLLRCLLNVGETGFEPATLSSPKHKDKMH